MPTWQAFRRTFKQALRTEDYWGATKAFLPTVLDRVSAPIFEWLVPRQKLGVFLDLAKDWIAKHPDADVAARRDGLGKLWDSVDNRLGQLVFHTTDWTHKWDGSIGGKPVLRQPRMSSETSS